MCQTYPYSQPTQPPLDYLSPYTAIVLRNISLICFPYHTWEPPCSGLLLCIATLWRYVEVYRLCCYGFCNIIEITEVLGYVHGPFACMLNGLQGMLCMPVHDEHTWSHTAVYALLYIYIYNMFMTLSITCMTCHTSIIYRALRIQNN